MQSFVLNEEQQLLAKTARDMVEEASPLSRVRSLRDGGSALGFTPEVWSKMAELGWTALPFSEADGGLGMGLAELVLVTEGLGRGLAPEPLVSSIALGGRLIATAGSEEQRGRWLPPLIEGTQRATVACHERAGRFSVTGASCRAERTASGFKISGDKHQVLDAVGADLLLVSATADDGLGVFVVPSGAEGLTVHPLQRLDSRNAAHIQLEGVEVAESDVLCAPGQAQQPLQQAVDYATVALCAEMLGSMGRAFEMTLAYLKERQQFGRIIGSFQALQHRAAHIFIEQELARSAVMAAARHVDAGSPLSVAYVCAAKARCNDAFLLTAREGVQMHGGIGMTDEHDIGLFLKRARVAEMTFGDSAFQRDRFAQFGGY